MAPGPGVSGDWLARTEDAEHQRQKREVLYQGRPSRGPDEIFFSVEDSANPV